MPSEKQSYLEELIQSTLQEAKKQGATQAEASASATTGFSVQVRLGDIESIEYHDDQGISITVYCGQSQGSASTADLRPEALQLAIQSAVTMAKQTQADPCNGLADPELFSSDYPELNLYHPWNITTEEAIKLAIQCEDQGRDTDKRISNSEGVSFSTQDSTSAYGNSHGFMGSYLHTQHNMSCTLVASHLQDMQRDYAYTVSCDPTELLSGKKLAAEAAAKTLARLNPRSLETCHIPVIFSAELARGLIGHFVSAISGGAIYRQSSFLCGKLDHLIFPEWMSIQEQPHLLKAMGSEPFDQEGLITRNNIFVQSGKLIQYALNSYSARQLKMTTTANAGGLHNVIVSHGDEDLPALLKKMGRGLFVTELMGQGANTMTGDYSRGASGFWVENGEIQYPVHQITIAGTLQDIFARLVAIGNDVDTRGNIRTGSILVEKMTIAGQAEP